MASTIIAGNTTNSGTAISSDNTGALEIKTGSGAGTTALTIDSSQNVTAANNLVATQFTSASTFGFKNRLINGAMVIDQRNAGTSATNGVSYFTYGPIDRWGYSGTVASKYTAQQNAGSVTPPTGFINYLGITSLSAYSVLAGDYFLVGQRIEGLNTADLAWGTASAATITISFWVRSSLTGTFGGALQNSAATRSYPFTYTISSANTWEQKSITIAGDTSGTWLTTNGIGIQLSFNLGTGSTYSGTAGAWATANYVSATGATSVVGTNGATFYITGVQLEKGSTATSFEVRDYGRELILCERYFQYGGAAAGWAQSTISVGAIAYSFAVTMRTSPVATLANGSGTLLDPTVAFRNISSILYGANNPTGLYIDLVTPGTTANKLQTVLPYAISFNAEL